MLYNVLTYSSQLHSSILNSTLQIHQRCFFHQNLKKKYITNENFSNSKMQIHKELAGDGRCTFVCSPTAIFAKIKYIIIGAKRNNVFDTAS